GVRHVAGDVGVEVGVAVRRHRGDLGVVPGRRAQDREGGFVGAVVRPGHGDAARARGRDDVGRGDRDDPAAATAQDERRQQGGADARCTSHESNAALRGASVRHGTTSGATTSALMPDVVRSRSGRVVLGLWFDAPYSGSAALGVKVTRQRLWLVSFVATVPASEDGNRRRWSGKGAVMAIDLSSGTSVGWATPPTTFRPGPPRTTRPR